MHHLESRMPHPLLLPSTFCITFIDAVFAWRRYRFLVATLGSDGCPPSPQAGQRLQNPAQALLLLQPTELHVGPSTLESLVGLLLMIARTSCLWGAGLLLVPNLHLFITSFSVRYGSRKSTLVAARSTRPVEFSFPR